jgi:hypothetical protein
MRHCPLSDGLPIVEGGYTATSFTPRRVSTAAFSKPDKHARVPAKLAPFGLLLAAMLKV